MLSGLLTPGQQPAKVPLVPHTMHVKKPFDLWNQSQAKDKIKKRRNSTALTSEKKLQVNELLSVSRNKSHWKIEKSTSTSGHGCQEGWRNLNWSSGVRRSTERKQRRGESVWCWAWKREDREMEILNLDKFPVSTEWINYDNRNTRLE